MPEKPVFQINDELALLIAVLTQIKQNIDMLHVSDICHPASDIHTFPGKFPLCHNQTFFSFYRDYSNQVTKIPQRVYEK